MFQNLLDSFEAIRDDLQSIAFDSDGWLDATDLTGCCAIGAKWVYDWLNAQGITTQVVHNENHFWCRAAGYTIDLTATQFYLDEIYIRPVEEEHLHDCYRDPIVVESFTQEYMENIDWPDEQCPWRHKN